jgi:hypothetical protein
MSDDGKSTNGLTLEALADEIRRVKDDASLLRAENDRLSKRLRLIETTGRLPSNNLDVSQAVDAPNLPHTGDRHVSRRDAFKTLGVTAVGGVGAVIGSTLLGAEPAGAANGGNLILGQENSATTTTELDNNTGQKGFVVTTGGYGLPLNVPEAAVVGYTNHAIGVYGQDDYGTGVVGVSDTSGNGVYGASVAGVGVGATTGGFGLPTGIQAAVLGFTSNATGVYGQDASSGIGVVGVSNSGYGVKGSIATMSFLNAGVLAEDTSTGGAFGLLASSEKGYGALLVGGLAPLLLEPGNATGPPTTGDHTQGAIYTDSSSTIFNCVAGGTPGTWQRMVPAAPGYNNADPGSLGTAGSLNLLKAPIRVFDTRLAHTPAVPSRAAGPVAAGSTTPLQITGLTVGGIHIPSGAVGVIGNVTVVTPSGQGYLTLFPTGETLRLIASVNFQSGDIARGNFCVVGLNASGQMSVFSSVSTDVVFDVAGFVY